MNMNMESVEGEDVYMICMQRKVNRGKINEASLNDSLLPVSVSAMVCESTCDGQGQEKKL